MKFNTFLATFLLLSGMASGQAQNTWTPKADFPVLRGGGANFVIQGKAYFGLGRAMTGINFTNDFWQYDPETDAWTQKADFPTTPRGGGSSFSVANKGYYALGVIDTNTNPNATSQDLVLVKDVYQYDAVSNIWSRKADFPGLARRVATAFAINGKGYLGTGINSLSSQGANVVMMSDFWEYDPGTDNWTQKANILGLGRYNTRSMVINDKGYLCGGRYNASILGDFQEYNPLTDTWSLKAALPGAGRSAPVAFGLGSKGYVGTGYVSWAYTADYYEYDPFVDTWTPKMYMPTARDNAESFVIGTRAFVGHGANNLGGLQSLYSYNPSSYNPIQFSIYNTSFCQSSVQDITYTVSAIFQSGNVFNMELSDLSGSFTTPVQLGTTAGQSSGAINAILPALVASGNYKLRIVATLPHAVSDTLSITIRPSYQQIETEGKICGTTPYSFGGTDYNTPGTYSHMFTSSEGCDSFVTITLTSENQPLPPIPDADSLFYCKGAATSVLAAIGDNLLWYEAINGTGEAIAPIPSSANEGVKVWYVSQTVNTCISDKDSVTVTIGALPAPVVAWNGSVLTTGTFAGYQWYYDNDPIPGAVTAELDPIGNGSYRVSVTDSKGCVGSSAVFQLEGVGLSDGRLSGDRVWLYPNPVAHTLYVKGLNGTLAGMIYNSLGILVLKHQFSNGNTDVQVGSLPSGWYLLVLRDAGGKSKHLKFNKK